MPVKRKSKLKLKIKKKKVQDIEMYKYRIVERDIDNLVQLANIEAGIKALQQKRNPVEAENIVVPKIIIPKINVPKILDEEPHLKSTKIKKKKIPIRKINIPSDPVEGIKAKYKEDNVFKDVPDKDFLAINPLTGKPIHINKRAGTELKKNGYKLGINNNNENYFYK